MQKRLCVSANAMTTPTNSYLHRVKTEDLRQDPKQLRILRELDRIYSELVTTYANPKNIFSVLLSFFTIKKEVKGLYLWGGVGAGKTLLMDIFYDCLPIKKQRIHFHKFMRDIHNQLTQLQGTRNPLQVISKNIAQQYNVLCFDEFIVDNVADAMILSRLFRALFKQKICLVTCSNLHPQDLYKNGISREQFVPTIKLLETHTEVFNINSIHDYRLNHFNTSDVYHTPLGADAEEKMDESFRKLSQHHPVSHEPIQLFGRNIYIYKQCADIIWFDFNSLCGVPRAKEDYLSLANSYKTIMISNIPIFTEHDDKPISNFIKLIDILYDAHVRIIVSAAAKPCKLYPKGRFQSQFERTESRLIEMQSVDYFSLEPSY